MRSRFTLTAALLLSLGALAQPADPPHHPPAEALAACSGKSDGTACTFAGRDGREVSGSCRTGPQGEPAACMPAHPLPPPEAFEACSGLSDGASCTIRHGDLTLTGTCRARPGGTTLACAPGGGSPPPPRG